jgi:hypothetical protein
MGTCLVWWVVHTKGSHGPTIWVGEATSGTGKGARRALVAEVCVGGVGGGEMGWGGVGEGVGGEGRGAIQYLTLSPGRPEVTPARDGLHLGGHSGKHLPSIQQLRNPRVLEDEE